MHTARHQRQKFWNTPPTASTVVSTHPDPTSICTLPDTLPQVGGHRTRTSASRQLSVTFPLHTARGACVASLGYSTLLVGDCCRTLPTQTLGPDLCRGVMSASDSRPQSRCDEGMKRASLRMCLLPAAGCPASRSSSLGLGASEAWESLCPV